MNKKVANYFFSDVHMAHNVTPTAKIAEEIMEVFTEEFKKYLDLDAQVITIYIGGDFYDRLVNLSQIESYEVDVFIFKFLRFCKKYNAQLRILEGTPSHDWKQSRRFELINEEAKLEVDLKYFDTLSIEYNDVTDLYVLYVPDEWEENPEETLSQVKDLLIANNIDKVDIAVMHGNFEYQLPEIAKAPKHNSEEYLKIVKYVISIGHIHVYSTFERIFAQGSFSRISHGEEDPKGMVHVDIFPDGTFKAAFIENKSATIFKTLNVTNMDMDTSFAFIATNVKDLPIHCNVRITAEHNHPIFSDKMPLVRHRPDIRWTMKPVKKDDIVLDQESFMDVESNYVPVLITPQTIEKQLRPYLERTLSENEIDRANRLLVGLINDVL